MALSLIVVEQTKATEKNSGPMHPIIGLPLWPLECESPISRIGHGIKHTFGRIISLRSESTQPCMWPFFMGWMPKNREPICMNGAFHVSTTILRFVVASTAEAELVALYHNCQKGIIFCLKLAKMGHSQPKKPVHCDNATAVGIANNTIKRQWSRSIEMRFFWIGDKVAQDMYDLS